MGTSYKELSERLFFEVSSAFYRVFYRYGSSEKTTDKELRRNKEQIQGEQRQKRLLKSHLLGSKFLENKCHRSVNPVPTDHL